MLLIKKKRLDVVADDWIGRKDAAKLLGVNPRTLLRWRREGYGPTASRHKNWEIRYSEAEVMKWRERRRLGRPRGRTSSAK